jgi:hypothetical protein
MLRMGLKMAGVPVVEYVVKTLGASALMYQRLHDTAGVSELGQA